MDPETVSVPSPILSRVVECWEVAAEAVLDEYRPAEMDESKIFVFGRFVDSGANTEEMEAVMTPPGELVGVD
eukprot:scaffold36411_cov55-Cyclotella_meneghiniana.AAC.1